MQTQKNGLGQPKSDDYTDREKKTKAAKKNYTGDTDTEKWIWAAKKVMITQKEREQ